VQPPKTTIEPDPVAVGPTAGYPKEEENSIVCYCYRLTTKMLREAHRKCGSLKGVEEATRAGTGCCGCKVMLQSLFGEIPTSANHANENPIIGSTCKKPGNRVMKGFIVASGGLQSSVYSSNGVAPALGACEANSNIEWLLLDHRAQLVARGTKQLQTNETFSFHTRDLKLPDPFFGIFVMAFDRSNYGGARFNIYWGNNHGITSTHENSATGRPRLILPVAVDKRFISGPNTIYAALYNPHDASIPFTIAVTDLDTNETITWRSELAPYNSSWINANEYLFKPALVQNPQGRFCMSVVTDGLDMHRAIVMYLFFHNRETDIWTANHL